MRRAVLIVEEDDVRRAQLRAAFAARDVPLFEVQDPAAARAALGRADFGALLISEGKRQLSLRGLCQLAERRHPEIQVFVATGSASPARLRELLGLDARPLPHGLPAREVVDAVALAMEPRPSAFEVAHTEVLTTGHDFGSTSTESSGAVPARGGPPTVSGPVAPELEPTERHAPASATDFGERTLLDQEELLFSVDAGHEPEDATVVDAAHLLHEPSRAPAAPAFELPAVTLPDDDREGEAVVDDGEDQQRVSQELSELYLRLAPLSRPAQVLGVPLDASRQQIEQAYERRLVELDPRRVPEGSGRALLLSRVDELRAKVTRAFEALRLQHEASRPERGTAKSRGKTNPW